MLLTLGVVASMAGFYGGLKGERRWGWLFFLGIAIGLMGKGPVAGVLSTFPIFRLDDLARWLEGPWSLAMGRWNSTMCGAGYPLVCGGGNCNAWLSSVFS